MNRKAKDLILYFYQKHFPDKDGLVWPNEPLKIETDFNELHQLFSGHNYKEDYQILMKSVRAMGSYVPPLVNAYMNLSSTMRSFGTAYNHAFGETDETGILVQVSDILPEKRARHFESYDTKNHQLERRKLFHINIHRLPWWKNSDDSKTNEDLQAIREHKIARERSASTDDSQLTPARRRQQRRRQRRENRKKKQ